MQRQAIGLLKVCVMTGLVAAAGAHAELVRNPTQVGTSIDVGQIVKGAIYTATGTRLDADKQVLTRTGVYLTESGVYNDRLTVQLTIGGLFWFALPEGSTYQTKLIKFGPGVGQAQGVYAFGDDPKNPSATLQFGLFPHKYSESANLGEYLYRSGTYPGVLFSGGWSYINSAAYLAQGVRVNLPTFNGKLVHDFTVYMERDIEPNHDLSPGYMITARPVPFFEIGAGAVWSHAVAWRKESEANSITPERIENAYSKTTDMPVNSPTLSAAAPSACGDSLAVNASSSDCAFYTYRGFKTMARASMDFGTLLGLDMIRPGELKFYTEVALLGVADQPYYYDDKMERMPMMFGVNLPTFGGLDRLAFELEYRKTRFPNTIGSTFEDNLPIPINYSEDPYAYAAAEKKTDIQWTVYGRRRMMDGVTLYAQVASDHMRHFDFTAKPSPTSATQNTSDWYYVVRLEFGI
jgi:hypothetical protein